MAIEVIDTYADIRRKEGYSKEGKIFAGVYREACEDVGVGFCSERSDYELADDEAFTANPNFARHAYRQELDGVDAIPVFPASLVFVENALALPFVFKRHTTQNGVDKYCIAEESHRRNLVRWIEDNPSKLDSFHVEPFIETPSDRATSFRVYMGLDGLAYGSGLFYSSLPVGEQRAEPGHYDKFFGTEEFCNPKGKYYLGSTEFRSNKATGGRIVPLNTPDYEPASYSATEEEMQILGTCGIADRELPGDMHRVAKDLGERFGRKLGLLFSVDFAVDRSNNRQLLVEVNSPAGSEVVRLSNAKYAKLHFTAKSRKWIIPRSRTPVLEPMLLRDVLRNLKS